MVSKINPSAEGYNQLFPVAGVNNSTQGFRNNFTSIYNNLEQAKQEIDILHNKKIDFNQEEGDLTGESLSFVFDDNSPNLPIPATLQIKPNMEFRGDYIMVPNYGDATQKNGYLRYNRDTETFEISVGEPTEWILLSNKKDMSTFIRRNGDTVRGSLLFDSPTDDIIQVIGDSKKDNIEPSFTFKDDTTSGLSYIDTNKLGITIKNENIVVFEKSKNNLSSIEEEPKYNVVNFSPYQEAKYNNADTKNTKIHGQYRGFQKSHEYFIYKENVSKQIAGPLEYPLVSFRIDSETNLHNMAVAFNFDFLYSGGSQIGHSFIISGMCVGSFIFDNNADFVGIEERPTVFVTSKEPLVVKHSCQTDNMLDVDITFKVQKTISSVDIIAICSNRISETTALNFDLTGKLVVHYNSIGGLPIISNNLHD